MIPGNKFFRLGLIGWPLGHSLSPVMHKTALSAAGLDGDYRLYPIPLNKEGDIRLVEILERVRSGEIDGLNVTIPHKQTVIPLLDELSPAAKAIGAVNTILIRDGKLIGENTDWIGFTNDLFKFLLEDIPASDRKTLVLGAGGSARAVVFALTLSGWQVTVAARRLEQASRLAADFTLSDAEVQYVLLDEACVKSSTRLIVNTTPLGMIPCVTDSPWPADAGFPTGAALYDLVYNPPETTLMKAAAASGLRATNGLGMLAGQAARAFELWTGINLPVEVFRQAIVERMPV